MRIRANATLVSSVFCAALLLFAGPAVAQEAALIQYRVLATSKTSTMQKEMQTAAAAGFRFGGVMGGETAFGASYLKRGRTDLILSASPSERRQPADRRLSRY